MSIIEKMGVRWRIAGWKTKLGNLMIAIGGIMYVSVPLCPFLDDRISIGIVIVGWAVSRWGASNRFNRVFYSLNEKGDPDLNRSKLRPRRVAEGDLS